MKIKVFLILFLSFFIKICLVGSSFSQDSVKKPIVYFFLLEECVICQSYSLKMIELHNEFNSDFDFVAVFPNFISKPKNIQKFIADYHIPFQYKTDYYKSLVNKFEVKVTPEIVIYDEGKNEILYKGRIDNEFFDIGKRRRSGITDDLKNALMQIKRGEKVDPKFTDAIGCIINLNELGEK